MSEVVYVDVTFDILLEGTATLNDDYAIEKTNLIIPSGESSVNTSITALFDGVVESVETIKLSIVNLVNANDGLSGEPININVNDDRPVIELKGVMELDNYIDGTLKTHWINILGTKFELLTSFRLLKHEKAALLKHAINYFKLHLQQFKPPKSVEILNDLFKVS